MMVMVVEMKVKTKMMMMTIYAILVQTVLGIVWNLLWVLISVQLVTLLSHPHYLTMQTKMVVKTGMKT